MRSNFLIIRKIEKPPHLFSKTNTAQEILQATKSDLPSMASLWQINGNETKTAAETLGVSINS